MTTPMDSPQQQDLEGLTEIEHILYSHTASSSPKIDSFKKLEYIYQHFQDNEKIYESDPDAVRHKTDNTLYPHVNNDIEYGLFEDVINSYTNIQQTQHEQQLTPCTHAYNYITQHINNLDDNTQKIHCTLLKRMHHYLQAILPHHVIITSLTVYKIQTPFQKENQKLYHQWEFICKVNINIEMSLAIVTYKYHDFKNGDALTFKDKYTAFLQQELQNSYWCLHDPITTKSYQIFSEIDVETMPHAMYFSGSIEAVTKINHVPYQTIEYDNKGMFQAKSMDDTQVQIFIDNEVTPSIFPLSIYNKYPISQKYPKTESCTPIHTEGGMIESHFWIEIPLKLDN